MVFKTALMLFTSALSMPFILYQRDNCHLCDLALEVLARARVPDFTSVFIDGDAVLEAHYGERVPVLRDTESACELSWPFSSAAVAAFIAQSTTRFD